MTRNFSLYLDVLRLLAALAVVLSHWALPRFTGIDYIWLHTHQLGADAVVIFFVMSGLLISYAADRHAEDGLRAFAADRLSRLWSVAVPAILLMFTLDPIGQRLAPELYAGIGYFGDTSLGGASSAITFTNEIWFSSQQPGTNGPWWSLGYEAWYYVIFAVFFFTRSNLRWWLAGLAMLIAGPKIWLLMPSWLLGVWLWRQIKSGQAARLGKMTSLVLAVTPIALYLIAHNVSLQFQLQTWTNDLLGEDFVLDKLRYSDRFVWAGILGVLTTLHIFGMAALLSTPKNLAPLIQRTSPVIRWLAGGSFALYLVHFPIMYFVAAILPGETDMIWRQSLMLILPILAAYGFAELSERRRAGLRKFLRARFREPEAPVLPA